MLDGPMVQVWGSDWCFEEVGAMSICMYDVGGHCVVSMGPKGCAQPNAQSANRDAVDY